MLQETLTKESTEETSNLSVSLASYKLVMSFFLENMSDNLFTYFSPIVCHWLCSIVLLLKFFLVFPVTF